MQSPIMQYKSLYAVKKALKDFPNSEVIVTGCVSQIEKNRFENLGNFKNSRKQI